MIIRSSEIEDFPISLGEAIEIKHFIAILQLYKEEGLNLLEVNLGYYKGSFYLTEVKTQAVGSTREELDIIYEKNAYLRWLEAKETYEEFKNKYESTTQELY